MARELKLSIGQFSDRGRKEKNQDFHGAIIPDSPLLGLKGISIGLADGISSSDVGGIAAESAIKGFLTDYYCTSESWSVKTSAQRVIAATNSWLHSQTRRSQHAYDKDKGYVCTLTVMVVKSRIAHIFHIGDARVYRVSDHSLEQLTTDHRVFISPEENYLGRALGVNPQIEIDYQAIPLEQGDVFVLATDGVHEHVTAAFVAGAIGNDLDSAARVIAEQAYNQGSPDNLTVQIVRVEELPEGEAREVLGQAAALPLPPLLEPRMVFDGYLIQRQIHASSRSHIYLAVDTDTNAIVTVKIPSIDLRDNADYLRRFMMEEWVARRIDSPHVLKPSLPIRKRNYLYTVMEFVEGRTLSQWTIDNPAPDLETVRGIVEQIAAGLRAFHRLEMLHQDLRPANIMIDKTGTVKIIDFGSTHIAGVAESQPLINHDDILGTVQYTAPEYLVGESGSPRSDLYSLGVVAYQMLTGNLPYGAAMAQARTKSQQRKVSYQTVSPAVPPWVDDALRKSVHPDPYQRYGELSEFTFDLRHPNPEFSNAASTPLIDRNPLLFWQVLTGILICVIVLLLIYPVR
jgi:serine/threonine protein phosphatase PrpC/tRNA A-37 threonylcarbamoyl transferase component Bud32